MRGLWDQTNLDSLFGFYQEEIFQGDSVAYKKSLKKKIGIGEKLKWYILLESRNHDEKIFSVLNYYLKISERWAYIKRPRKRFFANLN